MILLSQLLNDQGMWQILSWAFIFPHVKLTFSLSSREGSKSEKGVDEGKEEYQMVGSRANFSLSKCMVYHRPWQMA